MEIAFEDIEFTKKALFNFIGKTIPGSSEEANNLIMLHNHPFFRLWGTRELDDKKEEYYAGELCSSVGKFCTPDIFSELQTVFNDSLRLLKQSGDVEINRKLKSIAQVKEISNLRLETISEIIGEAAMAYFLKMREAFLNKIYPRQLNVIMTYNCNLSCNFCFSNELSEKEPGYLDQNTLERILAWMEGKDFKQVSLFGGEPTIHPDFIGYIKRLNALGYRVYFASNGLYSEDVMNGLNDTDVLKVTFNIPGSKDYSSDKLRLLTENLRRFPSHIKKTFRITLSDNNKDFTILRQLVGEFRPDALSFALAFPSASLSNKFVDKGKISGFVRYIFDLIKIAEENDLYSALVKPIPLCEFTEKQLMDMLSGINLFNVCDIHQDNYRQLMTISHTGTFYPCIALSNYSKIHIDSDPTLKDIAHYNALIVQRLLIRPVIKKCPDCNLFRSHMCQGFCYSYYN
jgi:MoaA/NifB/PqqE/SkfB family radical SAM enzyme